MAGTVRPQLSSNCQRVFFVVPLPFPNRFELRAARVSGRRAVVLEAWR
jgi:hypothetical protein